MYFVHSDIANATPLLAGCYAQKISSGRLTSAMSFLVKSICATGCCRWANRLSQRLISRHCPTAASALDERKLPHSCTTTLDELSTCILGRCFGLFSTFILRNPTAIAPEETMTTRCPCLMRATAVSTMRERIDNRGSCVFSWTIELEPEKDA